MNDDERVVREAWENTWVGLYLYESKISYHLRLGERQFKYTQKTKGECWQAAREFTEARQEEVRQIDEEIAYFNYDGKVDLCAVPTRIIQRLHDIRAGLVRGMRTGGGA